MGRAGALERRVGEGRGLPRRDRFGGDSAVRDADRSALVAVGAVDRIGAHRYRLLLGGVQSPFCAAHWSVRFGAPADRSNAAPRGGVVRAVGVGLRYTDRAAGIDRE